MGRRLNIMYMQYRLHGCMYMNYQWSIMVDGDQFGFFTTENPAVQRS